MAQVIHFLLSLFCTTLRTRASLQLEVAALRHQLSVYQRSRPRPRIAPADHLLWACLSRLWRSWRRALWFVQPRTVSAWQQKRFRDYWRAPSQSGPLGRAQNIAGATRPYQTYVAGEPNLGIASHCGRTAHAWDTCRQIHRGEVSTAPSRAAISHREDVPRSTC